MENQSSSSSCTPMRWTYDVFVSFRGEDTRNNFADHLFAALHAKNIYAFRDTHDLKKGKTIFPELQKAIEESQILIVIFSKNYASSTWCLRELATIADCIEAGKGQTVLPVFFDVTPSDVRKQSGDYEQDFVKHEENCKQEVQRWREALAQVANLSGWDVTNKPQHEHIREVIQQVAYRLSPKFAIVPNDIVGIDVSLKELEEFMVLGPNVDDVRALGIWGMGGLGKSTLAKFLFQRIFIQFDVFCYIEDLSKLIRDQGLMEAQKQILRQTFNDENLQMHHQLPMTTYLMQTKLRNQKALIVLDNVDQEKQLDELVIKPKSLGPGSRIIIISRDEHILKVFGVNQVYQVQLLSSQDALLLFCKKAFKSDAVMEGYIDLTNAVLEYAGRLPLAINVLGSHLFGRDVAQWTSALARLKEYPEKNVMDVLRLSFDALHDSEREIFLDISCFFIGKQYDYVVQILYIRGFYPEVGIQSLEGKSLLTVTHEGYIEMHDLLKELGRSIVREKSPKEPRKWSRLWDYEDFHNVMLENKAAEELEAIVIELGNQETTTIMKPDAFSKMNHLELLILENVNFSACPNYLSNELKYLHWKNYPFKCLPPSFQPDKLVKLILPHSSIKQLWEGAKLPLYKLKSMNLSHSRSLTDILDFVEVPNLEHLHLEGCIELVQINQSIGTLRKLDCLNLKDCKNLVIIPDSIFHLSSLTSLNLSGCSKLLRNDLLEKPRDAEHLEMEKLQITESSTQRKSSSLSLIKFLKSPFDFMYSRRHEDPVCSLLPYLPCFSCLQHLDLSFCNLVQLPNAIGLLHSLERLNLGGNNFVTLPASIKELSKLRYLKLDNCKELRYLPELPSGSQTCDDWAALDIFDCPKLRLTKSFYSNAFSWMIQRAKVHMDNLLKSYVVQIVIPGGEIPSWFSQQNVGASIHMDSSPIMGNQNWIGVACCAAFVMRDCPTNLSDPRYVHIMKCGFQHKSVRKYNAWSFYDIPIHVRKDLVTVGFDHLVVLYISRQQFLEFTTRRTNDPDGIEFLTFTEDQPRGLHLEVKMCGCKWVFKEDLEQLIHTMEHSGNSSALEGNLLTNESPDHGKAA